MDLRWANTYGDLDHVYRYHFHHGINVGGTSITSGDSRLYLTDNPATPTYGP